MQYFILLKLKVFFRKLLILVFVIESKDIVLNEKATRLTLNLPETIPPQEILLNLTFQGEINDKMRGFSRHSSFRLKVWKVRIILLDFLDRAIRLLGTIQNSIWYQQNLRLDILLSFLKLNSNVWNKIILVVKDFIVTWQYI